VSALQETKHSEICKLHGDDTSAAYARASLAAVARIDDLVQQEQLDCAWERVAAYTHAADAQQADAVDQEADGARAAGLDVRCRRGLRCRSTSCGRWRSTTRASSIPSVTCVPGGRRRWRWFTHVREHRGVRCRGRDALLRAHAGRCELDRR